MQRFQPEFAALFCAFVAGITSAQGGTNCFLVAEWPGAVYFNDSYIISLTNDQMVAHARSLIFYGPQATGSPIVVADIAAGADGINRDLRGGHGKAWSWHVTGVEGFADATVEILDGDPTLVETHPELYMNTGGAGLIGFWSYTVVEELLPPPKIDAVASQGDHIKVSVSNLSPVSYSKIAVETATNLVNARWSSLTNISVQPTQADLLLPAQGDASFFRFRAYLGSN